MSCFVIRIYSFYLSLYIIADDTINSQHNTNITVWFTDIFWLANFSKFWLVSLDKKDKKKIIKVTYKQTFELKGWMNLFMSKIRNNVGRKETCVHYVVVTLWEMYQRRRAWKKFLFQRRLFCWLIRPKIEKFMWIREDYIYQWMNECVNG